jgi:tetratricopeptide (TPR) repeat protein
VVCLARPELLDERPGWSGEHLLLDPLPETEVEMLVGTLAPHVEDATRAHAAEIAEGNPLFLEQLLALVREDGHEPPVPQTMRALLAARLDCLAPEERSLLEAAAVVGKEFWRSALVVLSPPDTDVSITLQRLVRRQLIHPERSSLPGEDAFQFNHILIRDATYDAIVKEVRANLHEGFADWLEARESPLEEIVAYHLEQAYYLRVDLGPPGEVARGLATRAAERLAAAGRRAYTRGDTSATINLLERAARLYPSDDPRRLEFVPELGDGLLGAGRLLDAEKLVLSARDEARRLQREDLALLADLRLATLRMQTDPGTPVEDTLALAWRAVDLFQAAGDDRGLALAWGTMELAEHLRGRLSQARDIAERVLITGERSGNLQTQATARASIATALFFGLPPLDECVPYLERTIEWARQNEILWLEAMGLRYLTRATLEQGFPREASEFRRRLEAIREQIGMRVATASSDGEWSIGELRLDPEGVEARLRTAYETLKTLGEKGFLSTVSANLAQALYWRGKSEEAEPLTVESEALGADEDVVTQVGWRAARAMVLARQCRRPEAEALAREAVERANAAEYFAALAESYLALTEVLHLAERIGEASEALEQTLRVHEAKGCILSADAVRAQFEDLERARSR